MRILLSQQNDSEFVKILDEFRKPMSEKRKVQVINEITQNHFADDKILPIQKVLYYLVLFVV